MKYFLLLAKRHKKYLKEKKIFRNATISFYNFWEIEDYNNFWLQKFIVDRNLNPKNKSINFFSVFGPRYVLKKQKAAINIFFSGETMSRFKKYHDYCLPEVDLALGFDDLQHEKYFRLPLWILDFFEPTVDLEKVKEKLKQLNYYKNNKPIVREKFCSLIARHDENGIRKKIVNTLNPIETVDCAGKLFNNTARLQTEFANNKVKFLENYKFNICPENTNQESYTTEKLFESFAAGCIPIYWGSAQKPEPNIFKPSSIIFFDDFKNTLSEDVERLHKDPKLYVDFISQNPFQETAAEYIMQTISNLELKLKELINQA